MQILGPIAPSVSQVPHAREGGVPRCGIGSPPTPLLGGAAPVRPPKSPPSVSPTPDQGRPASGGDSNAAMRRAVRPARAEGEGLGAAHAMPRGTWGLEGEGGCNACLRCGVAARALWGRRAWAPLGACTEQLPPMAAAASTAACAMLQHAAPVSAGSSMPHQSWRAASCAVMPCTRRLQPWRQLRGSCAAHTAHCQAATAAAAAAGG